MLLGLLFPLLPALFVDDDCFEANDFRDVGDGNPTEPSRYTDADGGKEENDGGVSGVSGVSANDDGESILVAKDCGVNGSDEFSSIDRSLRSSE